MFKALAIATLCLSTLVSFNALADNMDFESHDKEITGLNVEFQATTTPENRGYAISETASEFLFLPARGDNSAQFSFSRQNTPIVLSAVTDDGARTVANRASISTNDYDFTFVRNISSATYLTLDLGYQTSGLASTTGDLNSAGLRDLGFGLTGINHNNGWNLIYGSNFTVSPSPAIAANEVTDGNRFSGGDSALPFIAFEAMSHSAIWGGKVEADLTTRQTQQIGLHSNGSILASAFYEVPIFQTARVGFTASGGRDHERDTAGSLLNMYGAGAYSKISLPRQADIILNVRAIQQATTTTDATLSLRKTL